MLDADVAITRVRAIPNAVRRRCQPLVLDA
jgi:hypothetical protein